MKRRHLSRRWSTRRILRRVLSIVCECFVALGSMYGLLPPFDLVNRRTRLFEDTPEPPRRPQHHPEQVRPDVPLSETELSLLRQLVHQRWPDG